MPKIELQHVSFCYEDRHVPALRDLDLTIGDGEFVCILGSSGCGKTTLLRLLAGLQKPTAGCILIGGAPLTGPGTDRAMVFQNYTLFPWMTALDNVQFGIRQARRGLGRRKVRETAEEWLRRVDMGEAAELYPCQMSGGMRQRAAIARALAMDAEILLLDEPFGALDARIRQELQSLLLRLWDRGGERRKTVVFVTHDIREAALLSSRILYMTPGRIGGDIPCPPDTDREALQEELLDLFYREESHAG